MSLPIGTSFLFNRSPNPAEKDEVEAIAVTEAEAVKFWQTHTDPESRNCLASYEYDLRNQMNTSIYAYVKILSMPNDKECKWRCHFSKYGDYYLDNGRDFRYPIKFRHKMLLRKLR